MPLESRRTCNWVPWMWGRSMTPLRVVKGTEEGSQNFYVLNGLRPTLTEVDKHPWESVVSFHRPDGSDFISKQHGTFARGSIWITATPWVLTTMIVRLANSGGTSWDFYLCPYSEFCRLLQALDVYLYIGFVILEISYSIDRSLLNRNWITGSRT